MAVSKKISTTIVLPNPTYAVSEAVAVIGEKISTLFSDVFESSRQNRIAAGRFASRLKMPSFNGFNNFNKKNILKIIVPLAILLVVVFGVFAAFGKKEGTVAGASTSVADEVKTAKIDREFKFPLKDGNKKEVGKFTYVLQSAELRHKIIVKGESASAIPGREFLIFNVKIVNSLNSGLSINSRDYIRVSVNGNNEEWLAPDIHSDPVEAQAISTKGTKIGVAINEGDKNIRVQVGEIDGKKEIIPVNF